MANVVEILIRAKNEAGKAFAETEAQSTELGKKLSKMGTIGTAAMVGVGAASIAMSVKFQSTMTMLQTQAGVSKSALKGLEAGVLSLAGKVGFSPDSLGEALYHIESTFGKLGMSGPRALNLLKIAAQGAAVGHADLVDVTNALDAAVVSGIPGVKNYQQAMAILNATVGTGDMKMQDLAEALGSGVLATVKGFGLTIKDVGTALAVFGDNNIRGAHAGTQLRMSVMALAVPAKAGQTQLAAWGYSANRLATDMRTGGLLKALDDLHQMFVKNGVTAKRQGDVITQMFGKKAGAGLNVLMNQLNNVHDTYGQIGKAAGGFGAAVAATNATAAQKYKDLKAQLDATAISLGDRLLPAVTSVLNFTQKHLAGIEQFAVTLGAIAVAAKTVQMVKVGFKLAGEAGSWIRKLLTGATAEVGAAGMQKAGDTMMAAAAAMQKAADTMVGADAAGGGGGIAGAGAGAAEGAAAAGASGGLSALAAPFALVAAPLIAGALLGYMLRGKGGNPTPSERNAAKSGLPYGPRSVISDAAQAMFQKSGNAPVIKIKADISNLQQKLAVAQGLLDNPKLTRDRQAAIKADISQLEAQIARAKAALAALNGSTATTYIATDVLAPNSGKAFVGKGTGGIVGAATGGIRNHLVKVGEHGMELVDFTSHRVYSNPDSQRMMTAAGHGRAPVVLEFRGGQSLFDQFMLDWLRKTVQARGGGDVQVTFGRTA